MIQKYKENNKKVNFEKKKLQLYYFIPLLLVVAIVPLIMRGKYIELSDVELLNWTGGSNYLDIFSYWKSQWLIWLTGFGLLFYTIAYFEKKLPFKKEIKYYIPLLVYMAFVIISTALCYNKNIALLGFVDMYQGMPVLLSYTILTFLMINYVNNERDIKLFVYAFSFLIVVEGLLGIGQYFGYDFFKTQIAQKIMIPSEITIEGFGFNFGKGTIYGTLFNTNFVGSYGVIVVPLSIAFLIIAKGMKSKFIFGLISTLAVSTWLGSNSRAGYLGMIVIAIFSLVLFRNIIKKHYKIAGIALAVFLVLLIIFNFASGGRILSQFARLNIFKAVEYNEAVNSESLKFENLILEQNSFTIVTNKETFSGRLENDNLFFYDENYDEIKLIQEGTKISFNDEKYKNYVCEIPEQYSGLKVYVYGQQIIFYFSDDGVKILGSGSRITEPMVASTFKLLDGYEKFASGRGYIWARSIAMLPDVFFKGYGPDNFVIGFPQDDFLAKLNAGYQASNIVDKAHNMYLQIAINTGVVSLIALLVLWAIYIFESLKLYFKIQYDSTEKIIGVTCLLSVIGYLVAGIFNDHIVAVSPLFWVTLGLGISINGRVKKDAYK